MEPNRSEWKFLCSGNQIEEIRGRLTGIMMYDTHSDSNGSYAVHSLYFDDYGNSSVAGNESGDGVRYKYRVRYYGNTPQQLHFERKDKQYGFGSKKLCPLSYDEYQEMMRGNFSSLFWKTEHVLMKKFCAFSMVRYFTPKVIIDYDRTAFVDPITHIRITLDKNITASYDCRKFLEGSYLQIPVISNQQNILEVKFDYILPGWIKQILESLRLQQITFSKYYIGRKRLENLI